MCDNRPFQECILQAEEALTHEQLAGGQTDSFDHAIGD